MLKPKWKMYFNYNSNLLRGENRVTIYQNCNFPALFRGLQRKEREKGKRDYYR